eukprot:6613282-Heterocapsa_arctica.AAC.1
MANDAWVRPADAVSAVRASTRRVSRHSARRVSILCLSVITPPLPRATSCQIALDLSRARCLSSEPNQP